jgi:hypothetical protein
VSAPVKGCPMPALNRRSWALTDAQCAGAGQPRTRSASRAAPYGVFTLANGGRLETQCGRASSARNDGHGHVARGCAWAGTHARGAAVGAPPTRPSPDRTRDADRPRGRPDTETAGASHRFRRCVCARQQVPRTRIRRRTAASEKSDAGIVRCTRTRPIHWPL